ncbi:uncharacterized protein LOC125063122 isoform X1 [Pieris napi]|uniref:Uncharacterized protein n=1 Tax=Pieris macdunnoughi TaxID=345717 RepID=A0A821R6I4_9NEOP|nr:uncharacterized protein LOC125063122 isoform X1 [Pieris napi]CAF4838485.1 unnamed protein product [Pieris macdunnoughi]
MNETIIAAGLAVTIIALLMLFQWRWRTPKVEAPSYTPVQLVHRLCPHNNVVQGIEVEQKDSLDEHLDVLTRKLADKEGRLRLSKYKIRETQNEIENLHALDNDVKVKYREIMNMLKQDLNSNEKECKKIQEQIEWVSRRRAELNNEVQRGQILYGEAALELASNLAELQKGRGVDHRIDHRMMEQRLPEHRVTNKPQRQGSLTSLRHRKEPQLPRATPISSIVIKSPPLSNDSLRHAVHRQ